MKMIEIFYQTQAWFAFAAAVVVFVMGIAKRKPNIVSLGALAVSELGLLIQLVISIVLVASGQRARQDTVEFFAYLIVVLMVPAAAVFWALIERTHWSTFVLSVGAFTVGVMLVRMHQLWFTA
jgi:hypothetical protein